MGTLLYTKQEKSAMKKHTSRKSSQQGFAMVFAILAILVLGILATTLMFTSQGHTWTSLNYRMATQSRYAAEAGVQKTMDWLTNSYTTPTNFAPFDMTKNPVQYNGAPVVLSAVSSVASNYPVTANTPNNTVATTFNTALGAQALPGEPNVTYSTYATLLRMNPAGGVSWLNGTGGVIQTWQITSVGSIGVGGSTSATVQVVATYERNGTPIFNYPIEATGTGCSSVNLQKGTVTDSYNSSSGPYSVTNSSTTGGNIGTNGNVNLGSSSKINGTLYVPNTLVGSCPDGITGSGKYNAASVLPGTLSPPLPWGCTAQPCYPPGALSPPPAQNLSSGCSGVSGCKSAGAVVLTDGGSITTANVFTLAPGSYGNLTIDNADVVHLSAGTYTVNSLNFSQDGQIVLDSGPVTLNLVGNCTSGCPTESGLPTGYSNIEPIYGAGFAGLNACSGGVTANPNVYGQTTCGPTNGPYSGIPGNLQIVYGGTGTIRLGGMPNAAVIYAPAAGYYTPGAPVGLYGSAVVQNFNDSSGSPFHYDQALQNAVMQVGQYRPVGGFSWSRF
jgi:Tfp pilus assembly protein PilX